MPRILKSPIPAGELHAARAEVADRVPTLLDHTRERGDEAVRRYSEKCDNRSPESSRPSPDAIKSVDKAISTHHALPTRGAARYTGRPWMGKYPKTVTYQEAADTPSSALLGEVCGRAARVEVGEGHARSGDIPAATYGNGMLPWNDGAGA
ncbi:MULTISPECIES: hypothetical protein [unclassified Streptomyces]|uniref:hypothetical protein n=1 Tax=unclassified Streptomyces TaxID=2593676 RepID=UPI003830341C